MSKKETANVVDLFSGVGGLSLGAARAGFKVRGAVDTDKEAITAHQHNFPTSIHLQVDISDLTRQDINSAFALNNGELIGIIGGPPCQGFSAIGQRNKNDYRNKLFPEFFRVVAEAHPKFFLAENVPGILRKNNSEIIEKAFSYVDNDYIILPPMPISASDYGAPTTRTRIFFFGYLPNEMEVINTEDFNPPPDVETIVVRDALRGLPTRINPYWQREEESWRIVHAYGNGYYASRLHGHIPKGVGNHIGLHRLKNESRASGFLGTVHSTSVAERYASIKRGKYDPVSRSYKLDPDGFCPTLRAGTGSDHGSFQAVRPLHPTEARVITPREAARLQSFPDWFQFSPTKWHSFRQIGSSVSPVLAEHLFNVIKRAISA